MRLETILTKYAFPASACAAFLAKGITDLYPPQADAITKGVLTGKSLLMSVPTAAGKTLIAELAMVRAILCDHGRCLYVAPLKALASEKYNDFKKHEPLGIRVGLAIGDADSPVKDIDRYDILVATAEKIDALLRGRVPHLINMVTVAVLDEIHFINDGSRGPTLEILAARLKQINPKLQMIALSATVSNAHDMAKWLNAELVTSDWRPIPLKEGVFYNDTITFDGHGKRVVTEAGDDEVTKLTLDTVRGNGQVLVFVNSRRSAQAVARGLAKSIAPLLTKEESKILATVSRQIIGAAASATKVCHTLAESVLHGVAFHHAGLKSNQRELIEQYFKANVIKVISCTPTLAAGVNLPARRAIIRDCKRFEKGFGAAYIPTSEYKQCAGRAGRPQYDTYGEAVLIAKTASDSRILFDRYIHAASEPVISKLDQESALRVHILSSIAGGYVHDQDGIFEFISHTFLYHQKQSRQLFSSVENVCTFLRNEHFIEQSGSRLFATALGALTSRLYIDPLSAIIIRNGLTGLPQATTPSAVGLLHLITCCPDSARIMSIGKNDTEPLDAFASDFQNDFILTPATSDVLEDIYTYMTTIKTTWMLLQWIEEEKEESICDYFNVGPGDVYRHTEEIQWLLYAAGKIAELNHLRSLTFAIERLRTRVRYGIQEELLDIVTLKGIGRVRARALFKHGITTRADLRQESVDRIAKIPSIGKAVAEDIISQAKTLRK